MIKKLLYNLNLIKKDHYVQPFIYLNRHNKASKDITDKIKWFEETVITCKKKELNNNIKKLIKNKYNNYLI